MKKLVLIMLLTAFQIDAGCGCGVSSSRPSASLANRNKPKPEIVANPVPTLLTKRAALLNLLAKLKRNIDKVQLHNVSSKNRELLRQIKEASAKLNMSELSKMIRQ